MAKVVLIGGMYGSGKSTTATAILENSRHKGYSNPIVIDYDLLIGNGAPQVDVEKAQLLRDDVWKYRFAQAIEESINMGHDLVLVPGTFSTRERRDRFIQQFSQRENIDLHCLFIMEPMKTTIQRIQMGRRDESHLVNQHRWREFYRKFNQGFAVDDHNDLLLPLDRQQLAPEYRALLQKHEKNQASFKSPELDGNQIKRWIVLPRQLHLPDFFDILRDNVIHPLEIRNRLGLGGITPYGVEHSLQHLEKRHFQGYYK